MKYSRFSSRSLSLFLLLVFSSIQLLQAFHLHTDSKELIGSVKQELRSVDEHLDVSGVKCTVCDFFVNKQSSHFHAVPELAYKSFPAKATVLNIDYSQTLYSRAVHTWTNKEPPLV